MTMYQLKPDAIEQFDRAGLSQADLARRSGITVFAVRDKLRKDQRTRGPSAWNMAKAYSQEVGIGEEAAPNLLFEGVDHQAQKQRKRPGYPRFPTVLALALVSRHINNLSAHWLGYKDSIGNCLIQS